MFAVIYQGYVKSGKEPEYREAWKTVARYFIEERGAIGSCLHRTSDGLWIAYSKWPDEKTRDASWPKENTTLSNELPQEIKEAILIIKESLEQESKFHEICMEVVEDLF